MSPRHLGYLPLLAGAMALLMARMLVMARLLGVAEFGAYSAGLLVASAFGMLGCLGLYPLLQREMPMLLARGREARARVLLLQAMLVACGCALALGAVALTPLPLAGLSGVLLAAALANGLAQQLFLVATVESRSRGEPLRYAWQNLARAVPLVGAGALAAWWLDSALAVLLAEAGVTLAMVAGVTARAAAGRRLGSLALLGLRNWHRVAWKPAIVLLGVSALGTVLSLADRWLGAELLPAEAFAQYAFAALVVLVAQAVQAMVSASVYPLLARRHTLAGPAAAFRLAAAASLALLALAGVAAVPAWLFARWAIAHWYPAYAAAIELLPVLLAVAALRVADFWSSFLAVAGRERELLALHLLAGAAAAGLWGAALALRGDAPDAGDIAWLALLLALAVHGATAVAATRVHRAGAHA